MCMTARNTWRPCCRPGHPAPIAVLATADGAPPRDPVSRPLRAGDRTGSSSACTGAASRLGRLLTPGRGADDPHRRRRGSPRAAARRSSRSDGCPLGLSRPLRSRSSTSTTIASPRSRSTPASAARIDRGREGGAGRPGCRGVEHARRNALRASTTPRPWSTLGVRLPTDEKVTSRWPLDRLRHRPPLLFIGIWLVLFCSEASRPRTWAACSPTASAFLLGDGRRAAATGAVGAGASRVSRGTATAVPSSTAAATPAVYAGRSERLVGLAGTGSADRAGRGGQHVGDPGGAGGCSPTSRGRRRRARRRPASTGRPRRAPRCAASASPRPRPRAAAAEWCPCARRRVLLGQPSS